MKKMTKFTNSYNYKIHTGESYKEVSSLTVPGQATDLKLEIARAAQTGKYMVRPTHYTDSEIPLPPMNDLTDIQNAIDYQQRMREKLLEWEKLNDEAKKAKEDAKFNEALEKRFAEYVKAKESAGS